ncbi:uncharacterized protein LOC115746484 isoform X2 [Rhodamnia argentea]|uniref:Uncharacterized protein LOC115746484 isoform X1 n=1 Tax=Rhodamnia argentea TaxID=178133 RepID=A0A8B8PTM3_9MYRT|nr:uncharacterized protein LOC115746484 isoform X1 [Rhodamnia argentea]XP_048131964.1 uncharacterized protein LOC115746484 isoform X2 [Rhodamnia argentea]
MQGNRGGRNPFFEFGDPFADFGSFGGQRSLVSSFFGGRDPFDDPFFTQPFGGGLFDSSIFRPTASPFMSMPPFMNMHPSALMEHHPPEPRMSRGPIIEEVNSDDDKEEADNEKKENPRKHGRSSEMPRVEGPDDEVAERTSKQLHYWNGSRERPSERQMQPQNHSFAFQSSTVTYGGANGAYHTSSMTRRTGSDGLTFEDRKEADSATRQATHRVSRGLHNKGHSLTRKLTPDGKVNTMQTLHNLNEVELPQFEQAWKGSARQHLPGWSEHFDGHVGRGGVGQIGPSSHGGWALPSTQQSLPTQRVTSDRRERAESSQRQNAGRMKANASEKAGLSHGKPRG